jgi:histone-lysine N-methyltransferase SETMAR
VTRDEKWILYNNVQRKCSWDECRQPSLPVPEAVLHLKKDTLCVWWDLKGILYYELLNSNESTVDRHCAQLEKLKLAIVEKHPALANRRGIIFHQDNACPHVAINVQEKFRELKWETLSHPPYSLDLAPSAYHLFRSLQNSGWKKI